jgi:hypothetical protein
MLSGDRRKTKLWSKLLLWRTLNRKRFRREKESKLEISRIGKIMSLKEEALPSAFDL